MTTTEQLMAQYGVAWFGFDESSGNVYDKLGNNYVGTVTGATRVQGWNGEGSAMNFNGASNWISFNNRILPFKEKTIKFKVKTTAGGNILDTYTTSNANSVGYNINISGGACSVAWYTATNPFASSLTIFSSATDINLSNGKWNEIMFTWTGNIEDFARLYINDKLVAIAMASASESINNYSSQNLSVGARRFTSYRNWFNGQIDDLQIYNKVLTPSDFEQKRLVIKSESNKNLVLSPISTRIKEIPNTEENTLLAQGGIIHEIDSAVDRPPISLIRTSTEYEIVGNNNSIIGKGKMFTIPIDTNFKTAFIEDNN